MYAYPENSARIRYAQELRVLNLMFSPIDLVKILGPNSSSWINMSKDLGTLEAGKIADIVLLGGNPLGGTPHVVQNCVGLQLSD